MCRRVVCRTCGRPSHAGCGMHVEQVLAGVPKSHRCDCGKHAGKDTGKAAGWLGRLFGRS